MGPDTDAYWLALDELDKDIEAELEYDPDEQSEAEFWQTTLGESDDDDTR